MDKTSEQKLIVGLKNLLPNAAFVTEESTTPQRTDESVYWIIDPLDGTSNYLFGIPCFAITLALVVNDDITLGVVYDVMADDMYTAITNKPSQLNGTVLPTLNDKPLVSSLLISGFPYKFEGTQVAAMQLFDELNVNSMGTRCLGSAAIHMAYVAAGRGDVFYHWGLKPWDVAGGAIIVKNVGGIVVDYKGGDNYLNGKELICGVPQASTEIVEYCERVY